MRGNRVRESPTKEREMRDKVKGLWLVVVFLLVASAAWATTLTCTIDQGNLIYTGHIKVEQGVVLYEHRCPQHHTYWLTQQQMDN